MDALAVWCRRWLGAPPAAELFEAGNLSTVKGLRLADGREVVVKVRPRLPRLAGCAVVHRALWTAGFPCPEPLADLQPLDGYAATAETLVPDAGEPPLGRELAALSAAALARLVQLAPGPGSVPSLAPSPSWTGWDHTEPGLWPAPEDLDVDLNAYPEPRWLDRVAAAVRDHLRDYAGDLVIGHGDWHPENLRWHGPHLIAVHDWDSVICQPEPAIAAWPPPASSASTARPRWPASRTALPSSTPTGGPAGAAGGLRTTRHAGRPDCGSARSTPRPGPSTAIPSRSCPGTKPGPAYGWPDWIPAWPQKRIRPDGPHPGLPDLLASRD